MTDEKKYERLTKENLCYSEWVQEGNSPSELYYVLKEIETKIENGTLIELPCKVGDTVYWANIYRPTPRVEDYKVYGFRIYDGKIAVAVNFDSYLYLQEISFTKADAEQRLKESENE